MDMKLVRAPRVLVVGAGAVGGMIAARMIEQGIDVTLLTGARRAEQVVCKALVVRSFAGSFAKHVAAIVAETVAAPFDIVIFATRAHMFETALAHAGPAIGADTIVVSLVDGGAHAADVRAATSATAVLDGMFEGRVAIDVDGVIRHRGRDARILIGARGENGPVARMLAALFTGRGIVADVVDDVGTQIALRNWFLACAIATTTATGLPLRDALRTRAGRKLHRDMLFFTPKVDLPAEARPSPETLQRYTERWDWESEVIQPPPLATDAGAAGAEARCLLNRYATRCARLGVEARLLSVVARTGRVPAGFAPCTPVNLDDDDVSLPADVT